MQSTSHEARATRHDLQSANANVEVIVLAAGLSRRMGSPKPFLPFGESTFIESIFRRLASAGFEHPILVANPAHRDAYGKLTLPGARFVFNDHPEEGMFRSLRIGLREVSPHAHHAMIALGDMPMVRAESYARLAAASDINLGRILVTVHRGEEGHPVLWPRTLFGVLTSWTGGEGARGVLDAYRHLVTPLELPDPAVLADVDTPEQYRRIFDREPGGDSRLA